MAPARPVIDVFDRRILESVQGNNLLAHREISEAVNLSIPAIARRLQRLRKDGVIAADISVVRPEYVGTPLTIIAHVTVETEVIEEIDALRERFLQCPQVQQCYYVTGDVDFVLIMAVRDMTEYAALTRSLFFESGNVRSFRTFVAMQRVKVSLHVPVSES